MSADNARVLERIRKLLAQANGDGVTAEEAQSFAERAAQLMARHGVEQAMLDAHRDPADDPVEHKRIDLEAPYRHERGRLLSLVGRPLCVEVYWNSRRATMVGRRSDIERAEQLYTALLLFAVSGLREPVDTSWCWTTQEAAVATRQHRTAWLTGFADRIGRRMREAYASAVEEAAGSGAELVLADRLAVARAHGSELFPKVRTHKARTIRDRRAYSEGQRAANGADLGQTRIGGHRGEIEN